jgi:electron transfer flavoprotein alpha subunit
MSILVYTENWEGKFKKQSFELISYGRKLADTMGTALHVLSTGIVQEAVLRDLGKYGAEKIFSVAIAGHNHLENQVFTILIAQVAEKLGSDVIILSHNNTGKALAPRLSARLRAGLAAGVIKQPESTEPFVVVKKVFNGNAFARIRIKSPRRILTLAQNSFGVHEAPKDPVIETLVPSVDEKMFKIQVKNVDKQTGKVILTDADIVVSGGRGMKGPENWGPIEELAGLLGAATACSRPVSDEGWRPHEEHTGQTGKVIAPTLYIAVGISGAIQHLAGVSSSKVIVAINKDPEAPIFEAANYGIVGDAFQVLPKLIEAVKELKAAS